MNFRFGVFAALLCAGVSAHASDPDPVTLPPVIVVGSPIAQVPVEYTFIPAIPIPYYGNPMDGFEFFFNLAQVQRGARGIVDVRCVLTSDLSRVTSHNDTTDRWLAAQGVYAVITAPTTAAVIKNAVLGTVVNPSDGKTLKAFKVTYADGGSEKWMIFPSPASSVKLFDTPFPNSLVLGDGRVVPSPACSIA